MKLAKVAGAVAPVVKVMQKGQMVAQPGAWKNRTIVTNFVTAALAALIAVAAVFGYDIQIDEQTLQAIGGGIAALISLVNVVVQCATSEDIGFGSAPAAPVVEPSPTDEQS